MLHFKESTSGSFATGKSVPALVVAAMICSLGLVSQPLSAATDLPALFNHHMVLQRDMPVPIFGTDTPGTTVTVTFAGQSVSGQATDQGQWRVMLAPLPASSEGRSLTVTGTTELVLRDVLVGEVWMGCGQSNMVIAVSGSGFSRDYPKDQTRPLIRYSATPSDKERKALLKSGQAFRWNPEWMVCTPENIPKVGGILFAFADRLHQEYQVPIGIVNRAIGGNPVRSFVNQADLHDDEAVQAEIKRLVALTKRDEERAQRHAELWKAFCAEYTRKEREDMRFLRPPGLASGRAGEPRLSGKMGKGWELLIDPLLGCAMRGVVWDQGESGTGMLSRAGLGFCTRAMIRNWRMYWPDIPFIVMQKPSGHGRNRWGKKGVAEDQVVPLPERPPRYPWTSGYKAEEYLTIIEEPRTWMVNTMDIILSVHPTRKDVNGRRAADIAISEVYRSRDIAWRAPRFARATFDQGKAVVHFEHVGDGFQVLGGPKITGFVLAGSDRVFHWAEARIVGETIEVQCPEVPDPAALRYAFGYKHVPWANLFGANGRPVQVFRTDDWLDVP